VRTARLLLIAIILGAASPGALAEVAYSEIVVEVALNDQSDSQSFIVRRSSDGHLLLREDDLRTLRLRAGVAAVVEIDGIRYVDVATEPRFRVSFDEAEQRATIAAAPELFTETRRNSASSALPDISAAAPGGFLNYDVSASDDGRHENVGAFLESGFFNAHGVLTASALVSNDDGAGRASRLDTTWSRDLPERLATFRIGDAISEASSWSHAVRFAGVKFGTNFSTQPTLITTPLLSATGSAVVPSTVDVFVNGRRVASEAVPPGPFTLDRLPAITGAGEMQVVVTDALGRQQVLTQPYYSGNELLREGLDSYSFEAGALRESYGSAADRYAGWVTSASWRRGWTPDLTLGAHAEAANGGRGALGAEAARRFGTIGIGTATLATGGDGAGWGWLGGLGFERNGRRISLSLNGLAASDGFRRVGDSYELNRMRTRLFGAVGVNLQQRGTLTLALARQDYWNAEPLDTLGVSYSVSIGRWGYLNLTGSQSRASESSTELMLSWTLALEKSRNVNVSLHHSPDPYGEDFEAVARMQQALPVGSGVGYSLSGSTTGNYRAQAELQGRAGLVGGEVARRDGSEGWRLGAIGGVAVTGAGIIPSRTLSQSFAVVKVADYSGLTVMLDQQPIGTTDAHGRVLIDRVRPYESNQVSLDPREIPFDAELQTATMTVTPAWRSGPVVAFPIERVHAATMRLVLETGVPVPAGASVRIGDRSFPVALDGFTYASGLDRKMLVQASWAPDGRCEFELEAAAAGEVVTLGDIVCRKPQSGESRQLR
jgi:outer membrane usher protein